MKETNSDIQNLIVESDMWKVGLIYEPWYSPKKTLSNQTYDFILEINDYDDEWSSQLAIVCTKKQSQEKTCLIKGIDGGGYLQLSTDHDKRQTIKLIKNELVMSLGFTMASINLDALNFNWKIRPDTAEIFDFYDLEDDFLIRGEVEIHRIDRNGNLKWSFGGLDIWFNPDGLEEVKIHKDSIELVDFQSNKFIIDYHGKSIEG